jgi:predicted esterase
MELSREAQASDIDAEVRPYGTDALFVRSHLTLTQNGLRVPCGLLEPRERGTRRPGIVIMAGRGMGRRAIEHVVDIKNVVVVALDYGYEPRPGFALRTFLRDLPEMRRAAQDAVPSARLALEYLRLRPDVDPTRIILLGYSYGAPLVPQIAAEDKGLAVAGMIYGGGHLRSLIAHNVRRSRGWVMSQVAGILGSLALSPLDPLKHAGDVAPTRLLMVNGRLDELIPRRNAEALYRRARNPKKIVWLDSTHVSPKNLELSRRIAGVIRDELLAMQLLNATHMA